MNFFVENVWMVAAFPLWAFLIIVVGKNTLAYENKKISSYLTISATAIGLIFSCFILLWTIKTPNVLYQYSFPWLNAGLVKLSLGWMVDNLSAMMLMVVTSVSLLIQIYSQEYIAQDEGYHRFFAYLALFNFSMLGLVMSSNLFETYIFWELVGLSSYLLIGFWYKRPSAASATKKAFIINRIGDFGLLSGIIGLLYFSLSWWGQNTDVYLNFSQLGQASAYAFHNAGSFNFELIAIGILLGAIAKSAQFPLHTWLPDAMEGPTPISALIHAATMVATGIFLIARTYPIFMYCPIARSVMTFVGATTAIMTALIAMSQLDIKKILAYSTCSQLGFMVMSMGIGAYSAGLFHLVTHAYFKALLFLCVGAVIHGLSEQQDIRYMGGLRKHMPAVAYTYLIGALAISGILFSGFWSKEEILGHLYSSGYPRIFALSLLTSAMTSFYMFRSYFLIFEGEYRGKVIPHNPTKVMTLPLILFAVPSVVLGFAFSGHLSFLGINSFSSFIYYLRVINESININVVVLSLISVFSGLLIALVFYCNRFRQILKLETQMVKIKIMPLYKLSLNKFYIDEIYAWFVEYIILGFSKILSAFDKYVVDGVVNFSAYNIRLYGSILTFFQNGNLQTYIAILFGGLLLITASIIFSFKF